METEATTGVPQTSNAYRVLARKYRPQTFRDLVGQEPMVRTLRNAFAANRIHQAYIFTGVRGVGKTTTARIIARGLNFEREDGSGGPTVDLDSMGKHCQAILESRHVDVIEMDAASHTSINDIREIIESVSYRPAYARYKVYIIDEVHMLSTAAFNGLLKTLEEPPPHVKFLFATTEIRKVPVTVLSRCQRFDLRRIVASDMTAYLRTIAGQEQVDIEDEALSLIARASEGSMRDALSLMDQAIAHGHGLIGAESLRVMLGLADRARVIDLFEAVMKGDAARALTELREQYDAGADPVSIIADLADYVHTVTRLKVVPGDGHDPSLSESEQVRGRAFAEALPQRVLTRAWQILLKGLQEVQTAARPVAAAEMLLIRLVHAADLPSPDEVLRRLKSQMSGGAPALAGPPPAPGGGSGAIATARGASLPASVPVRSAPRPEAHAQPTMRIRRFEDIPAIAAEKRDIALKLAIERDIRLVRFEEGRIEINVAEGAGDIAMKLSRALQGWTGTRWIVALSQEQGAPTLQEVERERRANDERGVRANPAVRAILDAFPGAEIVRVQLQRSEPEAPDVDEADGASQMVPLDPDDDDDAL
ncbi:MAG: DNA polymerase III subunit gamma/tau [Proteobacteria bacterium]|nr:DNA polymerase III subunit gamma/tau [Pseudomonadota bacterium]